MQHYPRQVSDIAVKISNSCIILMTMIIIATPQCPSSYIRTPYGSCVNLLIDFDNCGSIGQICTTNYTACSNGACIATIVTPLTGDTVVPGRRGSFTVDNATISISISFAVSMYGFTTSSVTICSNGASHFLRPVTVFIQKKTWLKFSQQFLFNMCFVLLRQTCYNNDPNYNLHR